MTVAPARRAALKVLGRVRRDSAFAGAALASELRGSGLDVKDSALATRLVYGVLSASGILDEAIARYAHKAPEPRLADVLRLAAYELLYGRAPAYAVVDQAVASVRAIRPQAAGMANAVLRRLAADAELFPWGDPARDRDALGRLTATPRWVVDLTLDALGDTAGRQALAASLEPSPSYVRLDPFARPRDEALADLAPAEPRQSPPDPDCFVLGEPARLYSREAPSSGWFAMDAAAQMAPALCAARPGEAVLDIGAGRGNKTLCLQVEAVRAGGVADITAVDLHEHKVRLLRERLDRSGVPGVTVLLADALDLAAALGPASFDAVLLDAPCTGLGTVRRYPEKRWRLDPGDVDRMATLQEALLAEAADRVRPDGRLVYSTCSLAPRENGGVVGRFLEGPRGAAYALEHVGGRVPAEWEMFVDDGGCFQSWPSDGGPDGHYVAVMRRSGV
jgi:16S rRNA (cytosine967-C5)-methyltransferase